MLRNWSTLVLLLMLTPVLGWAQSTGKISGRVIDGETGEGIPGANIMIEGSAMGAATNINGEYNIFEVPPGVYTLVASFVGYTTERRSNVEVIAGITNEFDFTLQESAIEGTEIEVIAVRPLVNPTATNAVRRMSREEFSKLPTRNAATFYAIQPGVVALNGEFYIRGGRADETEFLLEGISSRSVVGSDNVVPVIPEALEEVQVYAGGYSAELGGANAGIIQQVLRTGGSRLEGMVQYETDQIAEGVGETTYGYNDLTLTLGGPLAWKQHRFFGAVNYTQFDNSQPQFFYGADFGMQVDDVTGDTVQALSWEDGELPGIQRPIETLKVNGTLLFDFNPLRIRLGVAHLTQERRLNDLPIYNLFNQERIPQRDDLSTLANLQATYFLSGSTYLDASVGYFNYEFDQYDPLMGKPEADGQGGAILDLVDWYNRDAIADALREQGKEELVEEYTQFWEDQYLQPEPFQLNGFRFARPGTFDDEYWNYWYVKRQQSYMNFALNLTSQRENHEIIAGGNYRAWTVRDFQSRGNALASTLQFTPTYADSIRAETANVAADLRRSGWGGYGYDEFMNEVDDGLNAPKKPITAAIFVNDKIEFNDIIVNAGLRWDYFDMDIWDIEDPTNAPFNESDFTLIEEGLTKDDAKTYLQPRLGLSFPITDQSVFHLQYGKFAQMPDMIHLYKRASWYALALGGQNFVQNTFAWGLDPIKSTQYEIGMGHEFTGAAAFDITAFYRKTEGQLEITRVESDASADAGDYNLFVNGDFAIARGFEFQVRTRRLGKFMLMANYTLTDAKGTNSNPTGQVSALENGTTVPSLIQPLEFEERHRGSAMLDFRTGPEENTLLENLSGNLLLQFHSGHRYTRAIGSGGQRGPDEGPLLLDIDPRSRIPAEPLNASTTPWVFNMDLRLEKGLTFGPATSTIYMYITNLLDTRNVINVHNRTGDADNDGFLTNPDLSEQILAGQEAAGNTQFVDFYENINLQNRQHYYKDTALELFSTPRQIRLGVRVEF